MCFHKKVSNMSGTVPEGSERMIYLQSRALGSVTKRRHASGDLLAMQKVSECFGKNNCKLAL